MATRPWSPSSFLERTVIPIKLPDITPAQIAAFVTFVAGVATTLGFKFDGALSNGVTEVLVAAWALVAAAWKLADAHIRGKRADNADKLK